jgi:lysozyme
MKYLGITMITVLPVFFYFYLFDHRPAPSEPDTSLLWGVDMSHHQGSVDWEEISKENPAFLIMKASEGSTFTDPRFRSNLKSAENKGIPVGAYHFFSYSSSGKAQAKHFLDVVGEDAECRLLVLDVEYRRNMYQMTNISKEISDFMNLVKERTGKYPMIYSECSYYNRYLRPRFQNSLDRWICEFGRKPSCDHVIHQVTDRKRVSGYNGFVDYNEFTGSKEKFAELFLPCN